jgi:neutral trehalase
MKEVAKTYDEGLSLQGEYIPSSKEVLSNHEINIRFLSGRGCLISVGCKQIAFEDNQMAMEALNAYVANPYEESKKWNQIFNQ